MDAVIVGGGIAGPVAAMALQRVGIDATIYEAYPQIDPEVGSYLTVTANGLAGLAAIGADELAMDAGFPTRRNVLWNQDGHELVTVPLDSTLPGSPPAHTLKRSRLASVLQGEAIRRGIRIEYRKRLKEASPTSQGGVVATFADGDIAIGDLLIGADGVKSLVRHFIDPSAPSARYVGLTNFGGVTAGAGTGFKAEAWHLIFGHRAFFGYQAIPTGDVVWFANVPRSLITDNERATTSVDQWKSMLVDLFTGDSGPAVELIEAGELELAADNTHDLGHVPVWHRGSMIIIGDAAHAPAPTSGQGASMAIEDGIALAPGAAGPTVAHRSVRCLRVDAPRACGEDRGLGGAWQQQQDARSPGTDLPRSNAAPLRQALRHTGSVELDVRLSARPSTHAPLR